VKKALSGNKGSLRGFDEMLAQAPLVAAAFGKWLGFVLILITMKARSGNLRPLHGLAQILAQGPLVAAAFGKWPGFLLMLIAILALFALSLMTAIAIGRTVLGLFG
jgi:hypothetical protein